MKVMGLATYCLKNMSQETSTPTTEELAKAVGNGIGAEYAETPAAYDEEVNLEDAPDSGRPYLPQQFYVLVCINAVFGKSKSSGNNMITLEWEVVEPKAVLFKNESYSVEGTSITEYVSLKKDALGKMKALHKTLGLPMNVNLNNPNTNVYLGKAITAVVATRQKVMAKEGTQEPLLGADGKPIATNEYRVDRYIAAKPEFNRALPY